MRSGRRTRAADLWGLPRWCLRWARVFLALSWAAGPLPAQETSSRPFSSLTSLVAPPAASVAQTSGLHAALPEAFLHPDLRCAVEFRLVPGVPVAGGQCVHYAEILDGASLHGAALQTWEAVLATHPGMERAHIRVAQLLLESGYAGAAGMAAEQGMRAFPKSAGLALIAAEAMRRQGREYDARKLLRKSESGIDGNDVADEELLAYAATVDDAYGDGAAETYLRLAESPNLPSQKRLDALRRGFEIALRDGDMDSARHIAELLGAAGHPEFQPVVGEQSQAASETIIPGGRDGLSFIAIGKTGISEQKFLTEFARALLVKVCTGICFGEDEYKKTVDGYFNTVAQLEALGVRDHDRVSITLARGDEDAERRTERVLDLLGVDLRTGKGLIRLQQGVKPQQAIQQDMVTALGIDLIGIEKAFQAGKPYTLEIVDEPVEIYPNAGVWKDAFPRRQETCFAQTLLHRPQIARLYASVSDIDAQTVGALFAAVSPAELATRYANELGRFGPAFAVNRDGVTGREGAVVPGGPRAAAVWKELAGMSPGEAGPFFRTLLSNPPLLAYFYAVSELDAAHQAFFTANVERAVRFYALSKGLSDEREYRKDLAVDSTFTRFMRSVPLDANGHVIFPGSPQVWMVAKGAAADDEHIAYLQKKASETAAPAMEDAILSHLAETGYDARGLSNSELENFLAVSLLNAHLKEPMNNESALLLAQHYVECRPLYVYFNDLPGVNNIGLRNFFAILDQIRQKPKLIQNLEMGQLYSLLAWVSILGRSQAIPEDQAASLFFQAGKAMESAVAGRETAPLEMGKAIVSACGTSAEVSLDDGIRDCMLRGWGRDARRAEDFDRVLLLQKAPRLADLDSIAQAAQIIASSPETADRAHHEAIEALREHAKEIAEAEARLPKLDIPRYRKISTREREMLQLYSTDGVHEQAHALERIAASPDPDFKAARNAANAVLAAISPQLTAALAGPIYAYYLRSTDLIVSEDPFLLRKHRYLDFGLPFAGTALVDRPEFFRSSEGTGSHFTGGFGNFALMAGRAAAAGFHQGGQGAGAMIAAQIAAIRSAAWDRLTETDQRTVALRILAGREWIARAATDDEYARALSSVTLGVLSPSRRAELLGSISNRDWSKVWKSVPLPDLYTLGAEFSRYSLPGTDTSPVFTELRALETSRGRSNVDYLAHIPYLADGCGHLHMAVEAPYEEYVRRLMEQDLAERTADFKLYLAVRADSAGVEPNQLGRAAEKLASRAFAASQLSDYHDWRSLFAAYNSITTKDLERALEP